MLTITSTSGDSVLAQRMVEDLNSNGYGVDSGLPRGAEHTLIAVFSPGADNDSTVQKAILNALDNSQHILLVLARSTPLPKLIDHLQPIDFSKRYDFDVLKKRLDELEQSRQLPLKVLTPRARASNARIGLSLISLVIVIFALGIWAIITFDIEAPQAEYNALDTVVASTVDPLIRPTLDAYATYFPQSTTEAAQYSGTLRAVPTALRPFVALTATAVAEETSP